MARTYRTISLSLPPGAASALAERGNVTGRTAARVAAEIVLRELAGHAPPAEDARQPSWCCRSRVISTRGMLVVPETAEGRREWLPVVVLLCGACRRQVHGREYEGWVGDG